MVILRSPRACRGGVEGGWRRIGLSRLPAEGTEEKEPDADDQDRKGEETDDTGIGTQFSLTAVRIGRLGWHCARPRGLPVHATASILQRILQPKSKYALKLIVKLGTFEVNLIGL